MKRADNQACFFLINFTSPDIASQQPQPPMMIKQYMTPD